MSACDLIWMLTEFSATLTWRADPVLVTDNYQRLGGNL